MTTRVDKSLMLQSLRLQGSSSFAKMTKYLQRLLFFLLAISPNLSNGAPNTQSISLPPGTDLSTYHCNDSPAWSGPSFFPKDCTTAMSQFFVQELLVHDQVVFEFLAVGIRSRSRYPPQQTPQKFTVRHFSGLPLPVRDCI